MYCRLNQAIIDGGRNAPYHLGINNNMLIIMSRYQSLTFIVSFCEHSHTFVKIAIFVMVIDAKGIPLNK